MTVKVNKINIHKETLNSNCHIVGALQDGIYMKG